MGIVARRRRRDRGAGPPRSGRPTRRSPAPTSSSTPCIWQYGTAPDGRGAAPSRASPASTTAHDRAGYARHGGRRRRRHGHPGATLRKVVLSRPVDVRSTAAPPVRRLRRLRAGEPNCTIFSMPVPDGSFFGASPELLVARHGPACRLPPPGRHGAPGRHRPRRRRRPARPGRVGQEPRGAPLRGRRHRRHPRARSATSCSVPDEPSAGRLPLGGPPRARGSRAGWPGPCRGARAARAAPSHAGRRAARRAPRRSPSSREHEAGDRGHWAGPVGLGRRRRRRGVDDRHPQRPAPRRRRRPVTLRAGVGHRGRLGSRRRGGRDRTSSWPPSWRPCVPGASVQLR